MKQTKTGCQMMDFYMLTAIEAKNPNREVEVHTFRSLLPPLRQDWNWSICQYILNDIVGSDVLISGICLHNDAMG